MPTTKDLWVAEYSPLQGCFHIETAAEMTENQLRQILEGWTNSYLCFAVCASREDAGKLCDAVEAEMLKRGAYPDESGMQLWMPTNKHAPQKK